MLNKCPGECAAAFVQLPWVGNIVPGNEYDGVSRLLLEYVEKGFGKLCAIRPIGADRSGEDRWLTRD